MKNRIAIIGDIHGCIDELKELLELIDNEGVPTIYHLGDLVDRGPDSGAVVSLLRRRGIFGVMGNHESKLLALLQRGPASQIRDEDKRRSALSISADSANLEYLKSLPRLHYIGEVLERPVVLVHAGLWPGLPLYRQPFSVMMAQLIKADTPGEVAWLTDENARKKGLLPWWELWDGEEIAVFGHTVFHEPQLMNRTIGLDTGCVFGGRLTALILPDFRFLSVKAKARYAEREGFRPAE
jgi:predicted phosphodiesterase